MTNKPQTPIYTCRELAELVAEHDRQYPKHGNTCSCQHGLITAARALFACSTRPVVVPMFEPRPYVPPDVLGGTTAGPVGNDR